SVRLAKTRMAASSGSGSAGDVDDLSGDERGLLSDEERHHRGDVLWLSGAVDRDLRGGRLLEVLERHAEPLGGGRGHVGLDETGGDRVDGDAELAQLDGQGLGEALQA